MNQKKYSTCIILCLLCLVAVFPVYSDWPGWRGPDYNSISPEKDWDPLKIDDESNILWEMNAGNGFSSFAVSGNFLYTMGNENRKETIWCLTIKNGKKVWSHSYPCSSGQYPGPRCTPLVDGERVYTLGEKGDLYCLNAKTGKVIWKKNVVSDFKAQPPSWNFASSPVIDGDMLFLNVCTYGIALNKENGKKIWTSYPGVSGYASPVLCSINNTESVLMFGSRALYCVQRNNGKLIWKYDWKTSYDVNAADPVVVKNTIFISSGYRTGCTLIKIENNKPIEVWKNREMSSHFSSFVYKDGYIYGIDGNAGSRGTFKCIELATGKEIWGERLGFGSLVATEDTLIILTERGKLHIAQLSPKGYKEIAQATLLSSTCWTPPVIINGRIYCRNHKGNIVSVDVSTK
jgi:outer membrane protein assembly factor BamB